MRSRGILRKLGRAGRHSRSDRSPRVPRERPSRVHPGYPGRGRHALAAGRHHARIARLKPTTRLAVASGRRVHRQCCVRPALEVLAAVGLRRGGGKQHRESRGGVGSHASRRTASSARSPSFRVGVRYRGGYSLERGNGAVRRDDAPVRLRYPVSARMVRLVGRRRPGHVDCCAVGHRLVAIESAARSPNEPPGARGPDAPRDALRRWRHCTRSQPGLAPATRCVLHLPAPHLGESALWIPRGSHRRRAPFCDRDDVCLVRCRPFCGNRSRERQRGSAPVHLFGGRESFIARARCRTRRAPRGSPPPGRRGRPPPASR